MGGPMSRLFLSALVLGTACLVEAGEKVTLMEDVSLEAIRSTVGAVLGPTRPWPTGLRLLYPTRLSIDCLPDAARP